MTACPISRRAIEDFDSDVLAGTRLAQGILLAVAAILHPHGKPLAPLQNYPNF